MKLQVRVRTQQSARTVELTVGPLTTVKSIKDRLTVIEPSPFADQELVLGDKALEDDAQLGDAEVKDGSILDLIIKATETTLAEQLTDLLQAKTISFEELGLLYVHRYGMPVAGALEALGLNETLCDFLKRQCAFVVDGNLVSCNAKSAKPEVPVVRERRLRGERTHAQDELAVHVSIFLQAPANACNEAGGLNLNVRPMETVLELKERICASELIPFPRRKLFLAGGELQDRQRLVDCGVKGSSSLDFVATASEEDFVQQLCELLQTRTLPASELSLLYSSRHGATAARALKTLGRGETLMAFLTRRPEFSLHGGCVRLADKADQQNHRLAELHEQICGSSFNDKAKMQLEKVAAGVQSLGCLNVRNVALGGSVGRGTAVPGANDAEVVLFVEGLPPTHRERWLPGLVRATAATLEAQLGGSDGVQSVTAAPECVQVCCEGDLLVKVSFSPVYSSPREVIETFGAHPYSSLALAEHRHRLMVNQPAPVKTAMRLLKWWRGQQCWTGSCTRPCDLLLELVVLHAALGCKSPSLSYLLQTALTILADFENANLVWPQGLACYSREETPDALLRQRPLLMDPVNPLVNVADPKAFNPQEMMALARCSDFF